MNPGSAAPTEEARSIFDDLGYRVAGEGRTFRAVRDWKRVEVTALADPDEAAAEAGSYREEALRCFVTHHEQARDALAALADAVPGDWALIAVGDDGDYEVRHRPD